MGRITRPGEKLARFGWWGRVTIRPWGCLDRWRRFGTKCWGAKFWCRISFLEACMGIMEATLYPLGRLLLHRECLVDLRLILSSVWNRCSRWRLWCLLFPTILLQTSYCLDKVIELLFYSHIVFLHSFCLKIKILYNLRIYKTLSSFSPYLLSFFKLTKWYFRTFNFKFT